MMRIMAMCTKAAVATDPCDRALDDPALRQHDEAVSVAAAHDLDRPVPGAGNAGEPRAREFGQFRRLVGTVQA